MRRSSRSTRRGSRSVSRDLFIRSAKALIPPARRPARGASPLTVPGDTNCDPPAPALGAKWSAHRRAEFSQKGRCADFSPARSSRAVRPETLARFSPIPLRSARLAFSASSPREIRARHALGCGCVRQSLRKCAAFIRRKFLQRVHEMHVRGAALQQIHQMLAQRRVVISSRALLAGSGFGFGPRL